MKRFTLLTTLLLAVVAIQAADYYVSPSGNDSNAGTIDAPLLTLKQAISKAISLIMGLWFQASRPFRQQLATMPSIR